MTSHQAPNPAYILGAGDNEMRAIAELLSATHTWHSYAQGPGGARVGTHEADYAQPVRVPEWATEVVFVETRASLLDAKGNVLRKDAIKPVIIDHHDWGDPGFGKPPAEFAHAAAIGQTIAHLAYAGRMKRLAPVVRPFTNEPVPEHAAAGLAWSGERWVCYAPMDHHFAHRLGVVNIEDESMARYAYIAAADHCLTAAYAGECPGIERERLLARRLEERLSCPRRETSLELERRYFEAALDFLRAHYRPGAGYVDARAGVTRCRQHGWRIAPRLALTVHRGLCPECAQVAPWAQNMKLVKEAAAYGQIPILLRHAHGELAMGIDPARLRELARRAREQGIEVYGDPERGFIGQVYLRAGVKA